MSRLPIRARLSLLFALAMAVVLAVMGAFLYLRLGASLEEQLEDGLEARAEALAETIRREGIPATLPGGEEELAQVLGPDGAVLVATPGAPVAPLLSPGQRGRAAEGPLVADAEVATEEGDGGPTRLLAVPTDGRRLIVVGGSLEDRDEALVGLLAQMLVAGPLALALALLAGYLLAGAALRPVEAMRRRAGEISAQTASRRLPLPRARDEVRRLGQTLNAMLERLDAGLRRERRFVADAGHELRSPLAVLRTELELALRRPRSREELQGALRSAAEEVERLARLAEDLLVLASADEDRPPVGRATLLAPELLEGVARRFAARAGAAGRRLEVCAPADLPLLVDRLRLEQALGNLVDNALRHGAGPIRLEATGGTARRRCASRMRARASRRSSSRAPSNASAGPMTRGSAAAPAWASPSSRPSPEPTAARSRPSTPPTPPPTPEEAAAAAW